MHARIRIRTRTRTQGMRQTQRGQHETNTEDIMRQQHGEDNETNTLRA